MKKQIDVDFSIGETVYIVGNDGKQCYPIEAVVRGYNFMTDSDGTERTKEYWISGVASGSFKFYEPKKVSDIYPTLHRAQMAASIRNKREKCFG